MKRTILMIIVALSVNFARAQVTVALGSALEVNAGTKVHIPVIVTGLDAANGGIPIIAAEFHVFYNSLNVEYDTTVNFSAITPSTEWSFGTSGIEYGTTWIDDNLQPVSFPDGTVMFEIVFDYKGGVAILDLDSARCYLVDVNTTSIPLSRVFDGIITPSAGSSQSVWNGIGDWNLTANWSNGVPGLNTLAVIESGIVQIISNANSKKLTVNNGAVVRVMPGFALTVSEGIENDGSFSIESDASGTGSVISNGATTGIGSYTTRQYIDFSEKGSHLVSSPLPSTSAVVFNGLAPEKFTESTASWQNLNEGDVLQKAVGARISSSGQPVTLVFPGAFNSENVLANLNFNPSNDTEFKGLNLIGNPFPSALKANLASWSKTNTGNSVYVWDGYRYKFWNGTTGNLADGLIPAMQGFFVRADQSGATVEIPLIARVHSNAPFYKESNLNLQNHLIFKFEKKDDPDHYDETYIHISDGSNINYSSESDVVKLMGAPGFAQVFSKSADNIALAINTQPNLENSIPIVLKAGNAGLYQLIISGISTISNEIPLYLEDTQDPSGVRNIRVTPTISFNLAAGENTGNRYVLHFKTVGINELPANYFKVYASNGFIHIESERYTVIEQLEFYSVTGSLLGSYENFTTPLVIRSEKCSGGIAILRIRTAEGIFTKKVLLLN